MDTKILTHDRPTGNGTGAPLYSAEAELAVLGGAVIDGDALARAAAIVDASMFYREAHRRAFRAMGRLQERGEIVDGVTLSEELRDAGDLDAVGGLVFVSQLLDAVPTAANIEYHARIVRDKAALRRIAEAMDGLRASPSDRTAAALLEKALAERHTAARPDRFRLVSASEVKDRPPRDELVEGIAPAGGLLVLVGQPGACKSFLSLSIAHALALNLRWHDRKVQAGGVTYVAAEGVAGLGPRLRALEIHTHTIGTEAGGLRFVEQPVNLMDAGEVGAFIQAMQKQLPAPPKLVIFDTFARCMLGGDENHSRDVGAACEAGARITRETGAAVLFVHHTLKSGDVERGSSALRGAADTLLLLKDEDGTLELSCLKQKDAEPFAPIRLRKVEIRDSIVLEGANPRLHQDPAELSPGARRALVRLHESATDAGLTTTEWEDVAEIPRRSFFMGRKALLNMKLVAADKKGRGARYSLTPAGLRELGARCNEGATEGACTNGTKVRAAPPPLERGAARTDPHPNGGPDLWAGEAA